MVKPHLTVHFHCEETHGPVLEGARRYVASMCTSGCTSGGTSGGTSEETSGGITDQGPFELPGGRAPGRSLPAVLRTAHSLGVPVLLSLSNERLLRALADPAEHKALSDGVSRGRLLPTPVAAFGAELPILAPFEVADEIRLNIDLWKRALFTPPFSARPECDRELSVRDADPARICSASQLLRGGKSILLTIDLTPLELQTDPELRLNRLGETLQDHKGFRLASPAASPHGWADQALREILGGNTRLTTFSGIASGIAEDCFDVRSHGFPLEMARLLTDDAPIEKVFAASGDSLIDAELDIAKLDARLRHGLLMRRLTRSGSTSEIPHSERVRASYLLAAALIESLIESSIQTSADVSPIHPDAYNLATRITSRLQLDLERIAKAPDEQLLSRVRDQLPAPGAKPTPRVEFLTQLRRPLAEVLTELDRLNRATNAQSSSQGCHATA